MRKIYSTVLPAMAAIVLAVLAGCGSGVDTPSTPLKALAEVYAERAQAQQEMSEAYQAVYKAPKDQQEILMERAKSLAEQNKAMDERLAKEAARFGSELLGTEMSCEASEASGYMVTNCVFARVDAQLQLANILLKAACNKQGSDKPYFLFVDEDGQTVYKSLASFVGDSIWINFRITTDKGPELAQNIAKTAKIMIVSKEEYSQGCVSASQTGQNVTSETATAEAETEPEPEEPAYTGYEPKANGGSVTVDGVKIVRGANLAETLRKLPKLTWDYNADNGLWVTAGNVSMLIDDDKLTQKGLDVLNAILSDIANDIDFSVSYIKSTATVGDFEVQ